MAYPIRRPLRWPEPEATRSWRRSSPGGKAQHGIQNRRLILLTAKTVAEPRAVTNHVKRWLAEPEDRIQIGKTCCRHSCSPSMIVADYIQET